MTHWSPTLFALALTACATANPPPPPVATGPGSPGTPPADTAASGHPATPADLLARVETATADIDTLRAKITHVTIQGLLGDEQRRFGTLVYDDPDPEQNKPSRFAIHFDREAVDGQLRPQERSYVFDGRWLAERMPAERVFIRRELVPAGDASGRDPLELGEGPFALPLNLKADQVAERFDTEPIGEPDADVPEAVGVRLIPKPGTDVEQARIDLWFDRTSYLPVKIETLEDDETRQIIYLRDTEPNPELAADAFDTAAPGAGWRVEEHRLPE